LRYTQRHPVPSHIPRPPYAETGIIPYSSFSDPSSPIALATDPDYLDRMRHAGRVARHVLQHVACAMAVSGTTTEEIDLAVHQALIQDHGAYPSPLNYAGFPKSLCTSINEVICHGIPDSRPLKMGDVVSFDVSCFIGGVHGDNCATVIVGDVPEEKTDKQRTTSSRSNSVGAMDWRGIPVKTSGFKNAEQEEDLKRARQLVAATRESLYAAIAECKTGSCLTKVGAAIQDVADSYGYSTVEKYRGHGIGTEFHTAPYVKVRAIRTNELLY
jgi:methionyl aminopeptidase